MTELKLVIKPEPKGFHVELSMDGNRHKIVRLLAATFKHDPEAKEIFAEAIDKSSQAVNLPTPQPNRQLILIES